MTIHNDLREVMGLLGKATYNNGCSSREISDAHLAAAKFLKENGDAILRGLDDAARYQWLRQERLPPAGETQPAAWISGRGNEHIESDWLTGDQADAAIDTARQHGPALLARQEGEDARDAERYRVIRMYSVGAHWPREFELAGVGAPAGLAAFGRTDPFATFSRHTLDGLMDDALGLMDGPKDVRPDYKEWRAASTADTLRKAKEVVDAAARSGGGGG